MDWSGQMKCQVNNATGRAVAVVMGHKLGDDSDSLPFQVLKDGESTQFTINVGSGSTDRWWINLMTDDGRYQFRFNKVCDVEQSDLDSGRPVVVNIRSSSFDVHTPVSSPCNDNFTFKCPTA